MRTASVLRLLLQQAAQVVPAVATVASAPPRRLFWKATARVGSRPNRPLRWPPVVWRMGRYRYP